MKSSKLTEKYQATIPKAVRDFLSLSQGDFIAFEIEEDRVVLKRVSKFDHEWQKSIEATLSEWGTPEDDEAYDTL